MAEIGGYRYKRSAGGEARASRLTPEQRSAIATAGGHARWAKVAGSPDAEPATGKKAKRPRPPKIRKPVMARLAVVVVPATRTRDSRDLPLPGPMVVGGAALEIVAAEDGEVAPHEVGVLRTGLLLQIPRGYEGHVRVTQEVAVAGLVTVLNSPHVESADSCGEMCVLLVNHGGKPFRWRRGQRVAQLSILTMVFPMLVAAPELTASVTP